MARLKHRLPEVRSLLISAALVVLSLPFTGFHFGLLGLVVFFAALISACFYRAAKRPRMWIHLLMQMLSVMALLLMMGWGRWGSRSYVVVAFAALLSTLPALPVCGAYQLLYAKKFSQVSDQESEKMNIPRKKSLMAAWLKRHLPELFSLFISIVVVVGLWWIFDVISLSMSMLISAIVTPRVYKWAKRPHMWIHLLIQTICLAPMEILFVLNWPSLFASAIWEMLRVIAATLLICGMYRLFDGKQFSKNPSQEDENPNSPDALPMAEESKQSNDPTENPNQGSEQP